MLGKVLGCSSDKGLGFSTMVRVRLGLGKDCVLVMVRVRDTV